MIQTWKRQDQVCVIFGSLDFIFDFEFYIERGTDKENIPFPKGALPPNGPPPPPPGPTTQATGGK